MNNSRVSTKCGHPFYIDVLKLKGEIFYEGYMELDTNHRYSTRWIYWLVFRRARWLFVCLDHIYNIDIPITVDMSFLIYNVIVS